MTTSYLVNSRADGCTYTDPAADWSEALRIGLAAEAEGRDWGMAAICQMAVVPPEPAGKRRPFLEAEVMAGVGGLKSCEVTFEGPQRYMVRLWVFDRADAMAARERLRKYMDRSWHVFQGVSIESYILWGRGDATP